MRLRSIVFVMIFTLMASSAFAFDAIEIDEGKYLKIFYDTQFGLNYRDTGSGPDGDDPTLNFNFRRNRLGFIGTYNDDLSFYFQMEYIEDRVMGPLAVSQPGGSNLYVLDAQIRYHVVDAFNIWLGKLKYNFSRENIESCFEPLTLDRSLFVATPYKTSRDLGIALWGNFANNYLQYRVDAMDGKVGNAGDLYATASPSLRFSGRLQASLLKDKETGYGVAGTYLGKKTVLTIGAAAQYQPEVAYGDVLNKADKTDYIAYTFDIFYEQPFAFGTITASAAYLNISFDDAYAGSNPSIASYGINGQKNGAYVKAGYMLPNIPLQIFARYDSFTFANLKSSDGTNFYDQTINWLGVGANYYFSGQNAKITLQYSMTDFDKESEVDTNYQDFNTIELYVQFRF